MRPAATKSNSQLDSPKSSFVQKRVVLLLVLDGLCFIAFFASFFWFVAINTPFSTANIDRSINLAAGRFSFSSVSRHSTRMKKPTVVQLDVSPLRKSVVQHINASVTQNFLPIAFVSRTHMHLKGWRVFINLLPMSALFGFLATVLFVRRRYWNRKAVS